MFSVELSAS